MFREGRGVACSVMPVRRDIHRSREASSVRTSFVFCLGVIELDVGAMERGRPFVAIKQNSKRCAASPAGDRDYYSRASFNLWAT
jgi:hypothetical protein